MKTKDRKGAAGFTLIELLVVVLIIGILAAIAVPQYFKVIEKGHASEAQAFIASLTTAEEAYLTKYTHYLTGDLKAVAGNFDIGLPGTVDDLLKYYSVGQIKNAAGDNTWSVALERWDTGAGAAAAPAYYGTYVIDYTGGAGGSFSDDATAGSGDLIP